MPNCQIIDPARRRFSFTLKSLFLKTQIAQWPKLSINPNTKDRYSRGKVRGNVRVKPGNTHTPMS